METENAKKTNKLKVPECSAAQLVNDLRDEEHDGADDDDDGIRMKFEAFGSCSV